MRGFSLLELSIVLVIIGLLAGGIVAGQEMIRQAELRSAMTDVDKYKTAINTFRLKYNALPGDMKNAESYWGTASGGCPSGASSGTQTCNGNGDNFVGHLSSEAYRFWQHLANAGLVEGSYTGMASSGTYQAGVNVPASRITGIGYVFGTAATPFIGDIWAFAGTYEHYLTIGAGDIHQKAFTPQEVYALDVKIDDGRPGTGRLLARHWDDCTTATGMTDTAATYNLAVTGKECAIHLTQFVR